MGTHLNIASGLPPIHNARRPAGTSCEPRAKGAGSGRHVPVETYQVQSKRDDLTTKTMATSARTVLFGRIKVGWAKRSVGRDEPERRREEHVGEVAAPERITAGAPAWTVRRPRAGIVRAVNRMVLLHVGGRRGCRRRRRPSLLDRAGHVRERGGESGLGLLPRVRPALFFFVFFKRV